MRTGKIVLNVISKAILIFWVLISLIVLLFTIDRILNPNRKSISNLDYIQYANFSVVLLIIWGIVKAIKINSN
jgi:hypothetical protein